MRQSDVLYARARGTTADAKDSEKFKNLIGPMDMVLDRKVREKLITARGMVRYCRYRWSSFLLQYSLH